MDEITSGLDPDDLMDLDEGEGSDLDDDDEEIIDEPGQSPFQLLSSGAGSTTTSATSSPPNNDDIPPPFSFTGKPLSIRRGRGRPPRREGDRGGKPFQRSPRVNLGSSNGGNRMRRVRPPGVSRGGGQRQRFKQFMDSTGFDFSCLTSSPDDIPMLDPETGALIFAAEKEKPTPPTPEELPYAPEQWPGKVCALCNLGERSQLGQGEMLRLNCPEGFIPQRVTSEHNSIVHMPERDSGERSPRGPVTCRRQKSFNKCRHPSMTSEYIDEFTLIGYSEQPGVGALFESVGHFYVHRSCTLWSYGVVRNENSTLGNVGPVVLQSSSRKCSFCNHYGASLVCKVDGCPKIYHYPCATASGAFQELSSLTLFCSSHLNQVSLVCESSVCYTCKTLGDIANLMYCSSCGQHYHGICVGLAQLPGVRAGWQCRRCRICQVCRTTGDETKLMGCEQCDKVYHSTCQRPIVTTIPKYGWKCRCCRICGDCGSRTPGAGLSSRWHAHYTVCDSCYQQRNKGFSCPLCHRAYRAHAHREMVQCTGCRRFVHGTCDPEADVITYHQKKETNPDYEYVCLICKNNQQNHARNQIVTKRNSIDDLNELSASQESLYDDISEYDFPFAEESTRIVGLGKGKPYTASKIAKKRLGFAPGKPGRPKGLGKGLPGKTGFMKRNRLTEFGRKRGQKAKMRGIFGVPGVGLQRPVSDGKNDEEPGVENRLVLCSAKDKFVLTQDICVMCGALGTDQEGCLIGCVQCGQCYHPYCLNVKVTKVILQKGWRCLDCTVCEGCGQRNDEGRLILCDDCDISFHIYCMDPPLEYVPHGNWKCKWCAVCQNCGATDPGFNCNWMNGWTECGPCASHVNCPSCTEPYSEGDLIIQCVQCERWLHGACDLIKTEDDAERCAEEGYCCILCRPRDVPPPHLVPSAAAPKPPTPTKSPEMKAHTNYFIDGVYLSESGHSLIKSLSMEHHGTRKKRKKLPTVQDKEAGIMATIESVVAGGCVDNSLEESAKLELVDVKEEPQEIFKEGMIWTKEDGPPPEGFTIFTMENGVSVLRRKRQRNLQKLGIGGFLVRVRGIRGGQENDDIDVLPGQTTPTGSEFPPPLSAEGEKPRRKPVRRKPKSKLAETFPAYLQEAFFGKDLMDVMECKKEVDTSGSDEEMDKTKTIQLSQDELKAVAAVTAKQEFSGDTKDALRKCDIKRGLLVAKEEEDDNAEDLKDVLALPGELLDPELVDTIMNEDDDELTKNTESLEVLANSNLTDDADLADTLGSSSNSKDTKDELSDILGPHFSLSDINSKDVEDIFKGVLTDESQESQESNVFPMQNSNMFGVGASQNTIPQHPIPTPPVRPTTFPTVNQNNLNSPISIPPQSPYHSEYSNSPQFSPAFPEANSQWMAVNEPPEVDTSTVGVPSTYNQRSSEKMKADEGLGNGATISAVLYANMNHPEWKTEFPNWSDRYKQIIKKWRTLSTEQKAPYLQHARDNRSQLRMKKAQQSQPSKDSAAPSTVTKQVATAASTIVSTLAAAQQQVASTAAAVAVTAPVSEVCTAQQRPAPSLTTASTTTSSVSVSPPTPPHTQATPPLPVVAPPPASSPTTHQQFTVHGHFAGPGDHVGPAPNVTVNPHYQPVAGDQAPPPHPRPPLPNTNATDQQIRVLTPSEIMRTLPSLCQENYEPQPLDQEKIALQQKSAREAEQERQWKQLQAMRQQQAQQQQNVIHEQRAQGPQFLQEQPSPLQPSTPQELSPAPSPSPVTRQFLGMKSPPFPHPSPLSQSAIRTPTPTPPPHDFSNQPTTPTTETNDPYTQPPATPKTGGFQPRLPGSDSFTLQPPTPRPLQFSTPRPTLQGFPSRPDQPEINRQLRDLLQRQQFKKLDEQLLAGKGQQRLWPPANENQESESPTPTSAVTTTDTTFRQPLPPSMARPRLPVSVTSIARPGGQVIGMRMPQIDARMQGLDPRMRLILQQQQQRLAQAGVQNLQPGQQFLPGAVRFASGSPVRPASVEQYEQLLQRQAQLQSRAADQQAQPRLPLLQQAAAIQRQTAQVPVTTSSGSGSDVAGNDQEIPDNVTAELEKLEQETGNMVELHGVSDILGGLGDDDDELLAEMGADFNILEYADPELEALSGEKTNILDLELEEETINKNLKKAKENLHKAAAAKPAPAAAIQTLRKEAVAPPLTEVRSTPTPTATSNLQPPPLAVTQPQPQVQPPQPTSVAPQSQPPPPIPHLTPQQIHQQMVHQVQQAAAQGRPMPPGSKLQTPDGIIGVVMPNNNVQLQIPQNYHQRLLVQQLQNQKLQMRVGQPVPRMMSVAVKPNVVQPAVVGPRMVGVPPPPPPPYPGPPPPYPGNSAPPQQQQTGLRMGPTGHHPLGYMHPMPMQGLPPPLHPPQRRPLLLEEQPLLLEELLEQEKREQEKQQHQAQPANHEVSSTTAGAESESSGLLSDHDFERLKADIFSGGTMGIAPPANQSNTGAITHQPWQQTTSRPAPTPTPQPPPEVPPRVQTFNANLLPAPPLPPENIVTDQDKQTQLVYEQWLNHQNNVLTQQLRYYDTEVQKLRKIRKSLNSKQRQLRKSGNQLAEADAAELQRISSEQSILQKHLESSRKQSRQHGMLIQEYRNKQQAKQQRPTPGQSPLQQQMQSPLGPPASSPIHHPSTSQSPMMSPSASPLTQHSSPMHSPGPLVSHSPGPGSIGNILQSPSSSLTGGSNMSPMQPSPRIGTPHSQGDGSPGPVQSPSQICLPPPAPRMTSPQHRRVVTSPVGYTGDLRPGTPQMRFIRTPIDHAALQQRVRLASPLQNFQQKPGTVSPLSSPPSSQQITQQLLQKQLQQQLLMQQQQGLEGAQQESTNLLHSQRAAQLLQHRNLIRQQPQQSIGQPQPLTPQQHQMMIQQQQQLAKQQQQQIAQLQAQGRLSQQANPPHSPMPPKSPMLAQQIMSPHSMPASPMPPKSPMLTSFNAGQTPNSPISRSPAFPQSLNQQQPPNSPMNHSQYQPPNSPMPRSPMLVQTQSPMTHRRTPSANSSPAMPDRPMSVENPTTPRTPYSIESQIQENMHTGGGNPHNPNNPIPLPPGFGRFGYFKLGLRGGAPMWGFGRGAKRVPTPPIINKIELDKSNSNDVPLSLVKPRKESHLSKVSILKRKSPVKTNLQSMAVSKVGSLVSTDYNEFEDSSSPPPGTPPPMASTSRINVQRTIPRKHPETIHGLEEKPAIRNCEDIIDFDDNTVLSNEVSLSSAAQQNDGDDIEMESLSQNDLGEDLSSPLESDQIPDEYVLFPGNIGVGEDEVEEYGGGNMHIVIRSPTTSDDEFIMQDKTKKFNLVQSQDHRMSMSGTPESTEHDEINMDPSPEATEDEMLNNYDDDILVIDHSVKSPDEQISTKEDFEELIDEGSRKEKILKHEVVTTKHVNEVHKYATNTFVPQKAVANHNRIANLMNQKNMQKISLEPPKISPDVILAQSPKPASKLTSIILAHNTAAVRTNVLSVTKIVSSVSPAITFVSAATSQIASILPSKFTVPVISASAVRQLPNVKVIDKPSSSLSLTTHDSVLPKKIFEDDSVSPDSSNCEDDKSKDSSDEKSKSPCADEIKHPLFSKVPTDNVRIIKSFKHETNVLNYSKPAIKVETSKPSEPIEKECEGAKDLTTRKVENLQIQNLMVKDQAQRIPSPIISKTSPPVIIHNTPELTMTAQVIQETQPRMQSETSDVYDVSSLDDTKSVVISIPSPTPSQEQMLDNIALQALEHRRKDGKGIPGGFESFEDVLDMIENITGEPPTVLEDNIKEKLKHEEEQLTVPPPKIPEAPKEKVTNVKMDKQQMVPQLSPLSQPTDLTTNITNASQQLRTLLSLHTTTTSAATSVETVVKSMHKIVNSTSPVVTTSTVSSRVIQQTERQSPIVTNISTVIVPNVKPKPAVPSAIHPPKGSPVRPQPISIQNHLTPIQNHLTNAPIHNHLTSSPIQNHLSSASFQSHLTSSPIMSFSQTTPALNLLPNRTIHLMADQTKISSAVTTVISTNQSSVIAEQKKPSVITPTTTSETTRKPSLTLTAMLQSHPAATPSSKPSAESITAASLLASPINISRGLSTALIQAQPNAVVSPATPKSPLPFNLSTTTVATVISSPTFRQVPTSTNLLHTQLTKVIRRKSLEEPKDINIGDIKQEVIEPTEEKCIIVTTSSIKQEFAGCKFSTIPTPLLSRTEDSQNVLLKKLLQNTACASTQTPPPNSGSTIITTAPITTTSEAHITKATPTLTSLLPPVVKTEAQTTVHPQITKPTPQRVPIMTRETSFVSSPVIQQPQTTNAAPVATQQLHIDIKKCLPPSRTPSRDDLLSPPTPRSSCSQDSTSLQTPPLVIKKEIPSLPPHQSPVSMPQEIKKEFMDESSQHSEVSDHSRSDLPMMKEEMDTLENSNEKTLLDKEELKKQKRRMYQQKRRQNILNKETVGQPKKRPRKSSKVEEDYDTYIDGVLNQMRNLPAMTVSEPVLNRNFGVVPVFGSGDMSKLGTKGYDSRFGELTGKYGDASIPGYSDFYSTKPYGDLEPLPEKPPISTQRGFYDQEFPLIKFDTEEDKKLDLFCREDTPDSIVSSSSPECGITEENDKFLGLRLISDNEDEDDDINDEEEEVDEEKKKLMGRLSPVVPLIKPIPIRLKPAGLYLKEHSEQEKEKDPSENKENINQELVQTKMKPDSNPATPLKDNGNVTVTLTLTSSAAEDIMGVLRDLANILHIPAPTSYQIVERTNTPPSQKLGLYRTKGKDGKEGAPIDIQSILNGAAKFCKHCDVVILNNMIRRKVSDLPFLSKDSELLSDGEELHFCSTTCYTQFALMHRSPSISEDKAAAIIDHLSQKDRHETKQKRSLVEAFEQRRSIFRMDVDFKREDHHLGDPSRSLFTRPFDFGKYKKEEVHAAPKMYRNVRYKVWVPGCLQPSTKHKKPTDKEIMELLYRLGITVAPPKMPEDTRRCMFCQGIGDSVADGPARLLNFDVDKWVHLNCALWSDGVYETVNGALMNLENAIQHSFVSYCIHCSRSGATIRCFKTRCSGVYHLSCAVKDGCVFFKNKTVYCTVHVPKGEKDNELTTLSVSRRVYVNRDENRQVAAVMHHSDTSNLLRVGSLIFLNVGQLLPHQLQNFHTPNFIYPIGYKIIRFYWSMRRLNKRCRYICSIHDVCGRPEFRVLIQEQSEEDRELKDPTPKGVWHRILEEVSALRKANQCLQMFPKFVSGEDLFGLTEPAVVRVLESLPGIETLTDYKFKYGRNPLLELPLAINPSGAARCEPKLKNQQHWKRHHTQRTAGPTTRPLFGPSPVGPMPPTLGEITCPYSKQFVHSKSSQYKKMKQEWRNNVYLARSKIQGLGLYAARDLEKHTMVIEYIGEIIRTELAECREKQYEAKNRGIYMFRLDEERVVDATLSGGLARYINHSCNPNCVAETVEVDRDLRIIIFAKRRIQRGEELAYDYKFDIEDDQHKISCMCGAPNCRKWMN